MSMENLPYEVLSEIFIRLLAKQLAQMRCVSKSWNAILSESSFVKSHLQRSSCNKDEIFLLFKHGFSDCSLIKARPTYSHDIELSSIIKFPVNPQSINSHGSVIGSVNGLICFSYTSYSLGSYDYAVHIWNPSLSTVLTLPPCYLPSDDLKGYHFRFGFDPKTDDYKVVKLPNLFKPHNMLPQVEAYSMRKGSWELITQKLPSHITMITDDDNVCVDGHDGRIHWLGSAGLKWKPQMILAFDLGADTFHEIPLPDSLLHRHGYCFYVLGVLGGKLCVMTKVRYGIWEMWVMNEYGVADSWVKHQVFPPFSLSISPYGFTSQNELIFEADGRLDLYDPKATQTKTLNMPVGGLGLYKIVEYVDSLVWVKKAFLDFYFEEPSAINKRASKAKKGLLSISITKRHLLLKGLQKATHQLHFFYIFLLLLCMMLCFLISFLSSIIFSAFLLHSLLLA